jgi:hypothetical protein
MAFAVTQLQKILASDAAGSDNFGQSVAISSDGTTAVVGANNEDTGANSNNGAAYVYIKSGSTWIEQAKLLASDAAGSDAFGESIAISADGNTVIIGAYSEDTSPNSNNGAAYVFTRSGTTWTEQAKLLVSDRENSDALGLYQGVSLSADGNTALVGASFRSSTPAAYVFTRSAGTWTQQQKLTPSTSGGQFGWSVSLSSDGNTALIGASLDDTSPNLSNGAAYVFTRSGSTWTQQAKLLASDRADGDRFGFSVALSGDGTTAIIGSVNEDTGATTNQGAVYMFTRSGSTWTQQQKILANDALTDDNIGHAVSLSNDGGIAVVGSRHINAEGVFDTGGVYVFTRSGNTWTQRQKIIASDTVTDDRFGQSVSISRDGTTLIVGASQEDTGANSNNGAAYFFNINPNATFSVSPPTDAVEIQKLLASDAATNDQFGWSVSISSDGNTALIGAYTESTSPNSQQGAAYVFIKSGSTWTEQAKLLASDAATSDQFAYTVSISSDGNTAIIGAPQQNTSPNTLNGAAYIFTRSGTTWTQQQKLLASDAASSDRFGFSVSISGDGNTVVIGAYAETTSPTSNQGAAYVFTRSGSTWTQQAKLLASDAASNDLFGRLVSISADGTTALIAAISEDTSPNTDNGAAYVFTRSGTTWTQQQKLLASDAASNEVFGTSVSLSASGNTALIGVNQEDTSPYTNNGAAYVFTRSGSTWTQQAKLLASDPGTSGFFGISGSLSLDGNTAIIGAHLEDIYPNTDNGAAYIFTRSGSTWTEQQKITASDAALDDRFGWSVSVSGDGTTAFVGSILEETSPNSASGAVYVYALGKRLDNKVLSYSSTSNKWETISYLETAKPSTYVFNSSGSWEIPVGAKIVNVVCVGAGGGGGGGGRNIPGGTSSGGGLGGGGGGVSEFMFRASDIGGTGTYIPITIGSGGAGGAATASGTDFASGNAGSAGGDTSFGSYLKSIGGIAGPGGTLGGTSVEESGFGMWTGNYSSLSVGAGGGGGGRGGSSDSASVAGSAGSVPTSVNLTATTTSGAAGASNTFYNGAGAGGHGGQTSTGGTGFSGGAGGFPGGGGGGGGEGSITGSTGTGGAGGAGAAGMVSITVWYG